MRRGGWILTLGDGGATLCCGIRPGRWRGPDSVLGQGYLSVPCARGTRSDGPFANRLGGYIVGRPRLRSPGIVAAAAAAVVAVRARGRAGAGGSGHRGRRSADLADRRARRRGRLLPPTARWPTWPACSTTMCPPTDATCYEHHRRRSGGRLPGRDQRSAPVLRSRPGDRSPTVRSSAICRRQQRRACTPAACSTTSRAPAHHRLAAVDGPPASQSRRGSRTSPPQVKAIALSPDGSPSCTSAATFTKVNRVARDRLAAVTAYARPRTGRRRCCRGTRSRTARTPSTRAATIPRSSTPSSCDPATVRSSSAACSPRSAAWPRSNVAALLPGHRRRHRAAATPRSR